MPVWLLGFASTIFKPANLMVWVPILGLIGVITYAGVSLHNYIDADKAAKAEVISQKQDIADLKNAVVEEKQSVIIATQQMQSYEIAVQKYAATDVKIQQQVATVRGKLNAAPIIQEAQTNAPAASADLDSKYADMLSMFDSATNGASSASHGNSAAGQAPAPAAQPSPDQASQMAGH